MAVARRTAFPAGRRLGTIGSTYKTASVSKVASKSANVLTCERKASDASADQTTTRQTPAFDPAHITMTAMVASAIASPKAFVRFALATTTAEIGTTLNRTVAAA